MLLEVHERMQLLQLMPAEGQYEALKTIRRQREMLSFTPEEKDILALNSIVNPDGTVKTTWKGESAPKVVKDVPIDEYMTNLFRKKLAELEKEGKLNENLMSLYEKFVIIGFK
jgi:hypothetical protein